MFDSDFPKNDKDFTAGLTAVDACVNFLGTYSEILPAGVFALALLSDAFSPEFKTGAMAVVGARAMYRVASGVAEVVRTVSNEMVSSSAATASLGR